MSETIIGEINKECCRIEEDALYSGKGHFNAASVWHWVHYVIGVPMTVLAAWAGIDAFGESQSHAAYLALTSAALGAIQTFLGASEKSSEHKQAGSNYFALRNKTRLFREIESQNLNTEQLIEKIAVLSTERDQLSSLSLSIPYLAYKMARSGVKAGEALNHVDQ